MPDQLSGAGGPPAPPPVAAPGLGQPQEVAAPRRPSWWRAALLSLAILLAGAALGGAAYRAEREAFVRTATLERTDDGWRIVGGTQHEISGLGLNGAHLVWQNGASIEYTDLDRGKVLLLGPGPGMRTTWDPAVGDRYVIWFEAERTESVAARAVVYDTRAGRRWDRVEIGSVYSYPAISGERAVWSSAPKLGEPGVWTVRVAGEEPAVLVEPGYGAPVVAGDLVVWARSWTGPFMAKELATDTSWQVAGGLSGGKLTGLALSGRTLAWGQGGEEDGSGVVATCEVDAGETRIVASGLTGLAGPAYDGRTLVWAEGDASGSRVMAQQPDAPASTIAEVDGLVAEVAVSGDRAAWIEHTAAGYCIVVKELPR